MWIDEKSEPETYAGILILVMSARLSSHYLTGKAHRESVPEILVRKVNKCDGATYVGVSQRVALVCPGVHPIELVPHSACLGEGSQAKKLTHLAKVFGALLTLDDELVNQVHVADLEDAAAHELLPEEVSAAFPGSDRLERGRLLRSNVPLRDGEELSRVMVRRQ